MGGGLLKPVFGLLLEEVSGSTKVTNANRFASKVHLGVISNIGVAKTTATSLLSGVIWLMYGIILTFRSMWELTRECIMGFSRHSIFIHVN